jgi:Flp pilus assembly protein TadD
MPRIAAILVALVLIGVLPAGADQNDPRLPGLFDRLRETDSRLEAQSLEQTIWAIWLMAPDDPTDRLMDDGLAAMQRGDLRDAIAVFTRMVETAPDFAEAWNKRATALYMVGDFAGSRADVARTLELEPRHFGALAGLGLIAAAEDKGEEAIDAWERALAVNPNMPTVRQNIADMQEKLKDDSI